MWGTDACSPPIAQIVNATGELLYVNWQVVVGIRVQIGLHV